MAKSIDVIQIIGTKTCALAEGLTQALAGEPACYSKTEAWTMGFIVVSSIVVTLAVLAFREWRKRRQTSYL